MKLNFKCQQCGSCCQGESTISLTSQDVQRIAYFLGLTEKEFLKKYAVIKSGGRIELKTRNGFCIFFDKDTRQCKVHPVKPEKCKEWPFVKAIFEDYDSFKIIKSSCPGLRNVTWEELKQFKNLKKTKNVLR